MLIVLRTVATYAAAAALLAVAAHRLVSPVRLRVALLLAIAPLLFTGAAMLTGRVYAPVDLLYDAPPFNARRAELGVGPDRTPSLADVSYQMLPWAAAVRGHLSEGRPPLWNPYSLAGEPLLAVQQPAAFHPVSLASLALPFPQSVTFAATVRIFAALLFAYLFLREIRCGELAAVMGAIAWAFCDWMAFYLEYPEHGAAAAFPLLLLGLRRTARDAGPRSASITAAALVLAATSGHPETLLHLSAAGSLYFAFELIRSPARRRRAVLVAAAAAAIAVGLSAVVLLPFLEALPHAFEHAFRRDWYAHRPRAMPMSGLWGRLAIHLVPFAAGVSGHGAQDPESVLPAAYGGAVLFPLAFAGLFARCRERWFFAAAGVLALAVAARTPAADMLAKIPFFDVTVNERLVFVAAFSLCVLAALGADRLRAGEGAPAFLFGSAATLSVLALIASSSRPRWATLGTPAAYLRERLLLQVVPVVLGAVLIVALPRRQRATAGVAALAAILAASRALEASPTYPTIRADALYPSFPILDRIPRGEPYRIAGIRNALIPNSSAAYGLEDVRGYEAMTFDRLRDTFPLWCVSQPVWSNRIDDASRPFLSFLNVRWLLIELSESIPAGWRLVAEGDGLRLVENPRVLPRAFAPRRILKTPDPARALAAMAGIEDFADRGILEEAPETDWSDNGAAAVSIARYAPQEMDLDVESRDAAVVATSVTAWPGWRADLEGRRLPLSIFNHAFVAFRVPAGRHRVRLRYAPDSFRAGAAISLATLAACVAVLWGIRRR